jgi:HAE1 family hydrophobic/amphiphilic exporter-1
VALAMLIGGVSINVFSLMAMIILVGMVVNNAIIIVDYATLREKGGEAPREAIVSACDVRFRMIVMANLTTIVALTPLSLGLGFAGEIFRPLAVVEMGGVFAAGVLSLLVIPVIYLALRRWHRG